MRVAFLCGAYQPRLDGVSDYVRHLARALGQDVASVLVTAAPAEDLNAATMLAPCRDWRIHDIVSVLTQLRRERIDLLHIQYAPVAFGWRRAARLLPSLAREMVGEVPVVVIAHEVQPDMLRLWADADAVIATTDEHGERVRNAQPSMAERLSVVPIGPNIEGATGDPRSLAQRARARWGIARDAPLVLFFGFLHPVKGLEYLIRAVARAREPLRDIRLVLAGGWCSLALPGSEGDAYHQRLVGLIRECGLGDAVSVTGFLSESDVSALLFAADVVALPFTYGISFKSGSLLAALSHGRAIVGTGQSAEDPQLRPGEHLLTVPPRDPDSLASAILSLLENRALRERLAHAGREMAPRFDWCRIAVQHLALYIRLSNAEGPPGMPSAALRQTSLEVKMTQSTGMTSQRTEGTGKEAEHTHPAQTHSHDHYHVSHHHRGGPLGEWDHRTYWHTHEHSHNSLTHSHDYSRDDEERDHAREAHIHDHGGPTTPR